MTNNLSIGKRVKPPLQPKPRLRSPLQRKSSREGLKLPLPRVETTNPRTTESQEKTKRTKLKATRSSSNTRKRSKVVVKKSFRRRARKIRMRIRRKNLKVADTTITGSEAVNKVIWTPNLGNISIFTEKEQSLSVLQDLGR